MNSKTEQQGAEQQGVTSRTRQWLASLRSPRAWISPRRVRFWIIVLVAFYTLAGFLLVPWIARREAIAWVHDRLGRQAEIAQVRVNPYAMTVEIRGLELREADGSPLFGFGRLFVDFQPLDSLLNWIWTVRSVSLEGVRLELVRAADGSSNISRLIAAAMPEAEPQAEPPSKSGGAPAVLLEHLDIADAQAAVTDATHATPFSTRVGPVDVSVANLSTIPSVEGAQDVTVDLEDGARLSWRGSLSLNPVSSSGHVSARGAFLSMAMRYLADRFNFELAGPDKTRLDLDYAVAAADGGDLSATLSDIAFGISDLALQDRKGGKPVVKLPELALTGGRFAWPQQKVDVASLALKGLSLDVSRSAAGEINLVSLLAPRAPQAAEAAPADAGLPADGKATPATAADSPSATAVTDAGGASGSDPLAGWDVQLADFELSGASVNFDDKALPKPAHVGIRNLALSLKQLSGKPGAQFPLALRLGLASGGSLAADGKLSVLPDPTLDATIKGSDLALAVVQPYVEPFMRIRIRDGRLAFNTHVTMPTTQSLTADGDLALTGLDLRDAAHDQRVLGWREVAIDRFRFGMADNALNISRIAIHAPYARVQINADRSTNIQDLLVAQDKAQPAASASGKSASPMKLTVGRVDIDGGSADFADRSLPLPFATKIAKLEGRLSTLSTTSRNPAELKLQGQVDQYGLALIEGRLTPLDFARDTDIHVLFRNIAFPDLSPYTVKFAGRRIDDGRLEVNLKYRFDAGKLVGENSVVISDLKLGDKVEQPGAMDLPLGLAVALLKDADGKIQVDLPVSGDLNNPQFEIGGVIRSAITKLLTGIVSAPFRALGRLIGLDSQNFGQLAFEPGHSDLPPPALEQLGKLPSALQKRPKLVVEVPSAVVPEVDRPALQRLAVESQIDQGIAGRTGGKSDEQDYAAQRRAVVESLFAQRFPEEDLGAIRAAFMRPPADNPQGDAQLDASAYVAALESRLQQAVEIGDDALARLGAERAQAVVSALTADGATPVERVRTTAGDPAKTDNRGWVLLRLKLDTDSGH